MMACEIRVGTSGWHYAHWKGNFYPKRCTPAEMFRIYREHFDTVEINNTFYQLPPHSTFETWRKSVPPGFLYAIKGSRFLTHMKKLKEPEEPIERLFDRIRLLGNRLGPVLFQLPPRWKSNPERLDAFLAALPRRRRYAIELRDQSWLNDEIYAILRRRKAAFCIYDFAGFQSPLVLTANFSYIRLHGPTVHKYQGSYDDATLDFWTEWIRKQAKTLDAIYVYFDNDQAGYAAVNAIELKRRLAV